MTDQERVLRDLCIEIALGRIGGKRFNDLLIASGIYLDEAEWETANRILGRSGDLMKWVEEPLPLC